MKLKNKLTLLAVAIFAYGIFVTPASAEGSLGLRVTQLETAAFGAVDVVGDGTLSDFGSPPNFEQCQAALAADSSNGDCEFNEFSGGEISFGKRFSPRWNWEFRFGYATNDEAEIIFDGSSYTVEERFQHVGIFATVQGRARRAEGETLTPYLLFGVTKGKVSYRDSEPVEQTFMRSVDFGFTTHSYGVGLAFGPFTLEVVNFYDGEIDDLEYKATGMSIGITNAFVAF